MFSVSEFPVRGPRGAGLAIALPLTLLLSGCAASLSPLAKHTTAFATATNTIVNSSEDAYRAAIKLHDDAEIAEAVLTFDSDPHWNPYKDVKPLLTPEQLDVRIKVLDGLKSYAQTVADLAGGSKPDKSKSDTSKSDKSQPDKLDTAATAVGSNLKALSGTLSTDVKDFPPMDATMANGVSTAVVALGDFLIQQKLEGSVPKVIEDMDPHVAALCALLESDIVILRRQSDVDYQNVIEAQDSFIRHSSMTGTERRNEIAKIPALVREKQTADELLAKLATAIKRLAETHHALAKAAGDKNPEPLKERIADLEAAGESLGSYYESLSSTSK